MMKSSLCLTALAAITTSAFAHGNHGSVDGIADDWCGAPQITETEAFAKFALEQDFACEMYGLGQRADGTPCPASPLKPFDPQSIKQDPEYLDYMDRHWGQSRGPASQGVTRPGQDVTERYCSDFVYSEFAGEEFNRTQGVWTIPDEPVPQHVYIDAAVHIFYAPGGGLNVPNEQIEMQMRLANEAFLGFGYQFRLIEVTRNPSGDECLTGFRDNEAACKGSVSISPIDTFNFYFTDLGGGLLGYCYFPDNHPQDSTLHGCVNLVTSMPCGATNNYNEGKTLPHEVGHGVGIYHTFFATAATAPGPCDTDGILALYDQGPLVGIVGDGVTDTPAEALATSGCPLPMAPLEDLTEKDTCLTGFADPIHNYMDYSFDVCMYEFTDGQAARSRVQLETFHPGYLGEERVRAMERHSPDAWDAIAEYQAAYSDRLMNGITEENTAVMERLAKRGSPAVADFAAKAATTSTESSSTSTAAVVGLAAGISTASSLLVVGAYVAFNKRSSAKEQQHAANLDQMQRV